MPTNSRCRKQEGNTPLNPLFIEGKVPPLEKVGTTRFRGDEGGFFRINLREENVRQLRQILASYLGHFKHANAYKLTRSLFEKYAYLKDIFTVNNEGRLIPLYEPPFEPANMWRQYRWAVEQYGGHCIFFQVGKFCEFYGEQAERYGRFFGLTPLTPTSLRAPTVGSHKGRGRNTGMQCGFPVRYMKEFKAKALNAGVPYVVVGERGYYPSGLKKRIITEIYRRSRRDL